MKANELMIGDWVKTQYGFEKVREINAESIYAKNGGYDLEELSPIHLTAEILEKNGLLKGEGFELDFSRHHRLKVILLWTDAKGVSRTQITFYLHKPQYVHELQHALRLCGIEKEIEL